MDRNDNQTQRGVGDQPASTTDQSGVQHRGYDDSTTVGERSDTTSVDETQKRSSNKAMWIILVVLALLVGGGLGYLFGYAQGQANSTADANLEQQISSLQTQLDTAQKDLQEAKNDQTSSDQIDQLEQDNADLKQQVTELESEVADLKQQLEDAQSSDTGTTN